MTRALFAALVAAITAFALDATPAAASIASRCDGYGCARIHCNDTGDRCFFIEADDYDWRDACNGDCDEDDSDRDGYRRDGYRGDNDCCGEDRGYYNCCSDGWVCDPDGDRCYESDSPWWHYREYYRRHGYRWEDEG